MGQPPCLAGHLSYTPAASLKGLIRKYEFMQVHVLTFLSHVMELFWTSLYMTLSEFAITYVYVRFVELVLFGLCISLSGC